MPLEAGAISLPSNRFLRRRWLDSCVRVAWQIVSQLWPARNTAVACSFRIHRTAMVRVTALFQWLDLLAVVGSTVCTAGLLWVDEAIWNTGSVRWRSSSVAVAPCLRDWHQHIWHTDTPHLCPRRINENRLSWLCFLMYFQSLECTLCSLFG